MINYDLYLFFPLILPFIVLKHSVLLFVYPSTFSLSIFLNKPEKFIKIPKEQKARFHSIRFCRRDPCLPLPRVVKNKKQSYQEKKYVGPIKWIILKHGPNIQAGDPNGEFPCMEAQALETSDEIYLFFNTSILTWTYLTLWPHKRVIRVQLLNLKTSFAILLY